MSCPLSQLGEESWYVLRSQHSPLWFLNQKAPYRYYRSASRYSWWQKCGSFSDSFSL